MGRIISISVEINCNPERAFEMFSENELLESWICDRADVDAKVGGKYELFWNPPPENAGTVGCKATAVEPDKFVSFEWKGPKMFEHFMNTADPLTHVVVFFLPRASGTDVHLVHSGWGSSGEWEEARQWFEKAWAGALSKLQKETLD